ncbi:hypothetical protein [Suttonella ornithocola]|uniref:Uncharacterized protein n=1 Tax=Suttonella ornithocola TaxID=279832 RepID=A0A380MZP6_9GAMM|nr:hypothetical protein [Suttonella ornithocola]SUO96957.1 Uncharacterised protein [Suttonella ornithocola]
MVHIPASRNYYRFLHWQNIAYIETKDTSLILYYYEGTLFNGFPEADEPIPRNISSPDLSLTLPLDKLDIPFQHIYQIILSEWESRCSQRQYALPT